MSNASMFNGRYQMIKKLGEGGMGAVYHAYDTKLQRDVALKFLLGEINQKDIKRLQRETQLMATMNHPNVVNVYDRIDDPKHPCIVMELINGVPLSDFVKSNKMTVKAITQLMIKVAEAMSYIHKLGIVHRDLKLANIMIDHDGEPKIMDFGLAKVADGESQLSKTGSIIGSVYYMPPEQAQGNLAEIDHRSDIYALGSILYELVTKKKLFEGSSLNILFQILNENPKKPSKIKYGIPRDLEFICLKCLEKKKKNRYQTVADFANDLQLFQQGKPISAKKSHIMKMLKKIAMGLVLCAVAILSIWFLQPPKTTLEVVSSPHDNYRPDRYDIKFSCKLTGRVKKIFLQKVSSNKNNSFELDLGVQNDKLFLPVGKSFPVNNDALIQKDILSVNTTLDFGKNKFFVKVFGHDGKVVEKKWTINHEYNKESSSKVLRNGFERRGEFASDDVGKINSIKKYPGGYRCTPVVVGSVVYYGDQTSFRAVDFEKGEIIWQVNLPRKNDYTYAATWANNLIFVSVDNALYCLNAQNGDIKWTYTVKKENRQEEAYLVRFPLVASGVVFFSCDKQFYALDIASCKLLWSKKYAAKVKTPSVVSVKRNTIYFGEGDNETILHGLDMLSGKKVSGFVLPKIWWSSPVLNKDKIYTIGFDCILTVVDMVPQLTDAQQISFDKKQIEKWLSFDNIKEIKAKKMRTRSSCAISENLGYGSISSYGILFAFALDNHKSLLWTHKFEQERVPVSEKHVITSPIVTSNNIYVAAYKSIYALKKQQHKDPMVLWRVQTKGLILSEPVIKDGVVFCTSTDGNLYVLK